MTPNRFQETMSSKSENQLMQVVHNPMDWQAEALTAACDELYSRGMTDSELQTALSEGKMRRELARAKAELPLSFKHRSLYFLLSFLAFTPVVAFLYRYHADKGHERRSLESNIHVLLGIMFYFALYGVLQRMFLHGW